MGPDLMYTEGYEELGVLTEEFSSSYKRKLLSMPYHLHHSQIITSYFKGEIFRRIKGYGEDLRMW